MVTREEIENIALLSKLFVAEEELDGLTKEMDQMIAFADTINQATDAGEEFDKTPSGKTKWCPATPRVKF